MDLGCRYYTRIHRFDKTGTWITRIEVTDTDCFMVTSCTDCMIENCNCFKNYAVLIICFAPDVLFLCRQNVIEYSNMNVYGKVNMMNVNIL